MPDSYTQGTLTPYPWLTVFPKTLYGIAQQWYVNRVPFTSRLNVLPTNNISFNMVTYQFRPRIFFLAAAVLIGDTTLTVNDASVLMNGDKITLPNTTFEVVELTAAPNIANNTITVRRAAAGTTAAAIASPISSGNYGWCLNIGNTRTGGEKFQVALSQIPKIITQYIQQYQHVVSVSGVMQAVGAALPLPPGISGPFEKNKMDALQNIMDDIEVSSLFGYGEAIANDGSVLRQSQVGLFNFLKTNAVAPASARIPSTRAPSNPTAYKPTDFENDILGPIRAAGGQPSVIHINTKMRTGMTEWGIPLQRFTNGVTKFGSDISYFTSPFLGDIKIVENMWLNLVDPTGANTVGAALVLTEEEVRFRSLEQLKYRPYARVGDTGDAGEGDYIARQAIEVDNEPHHGFVTGITGFAQQT